MIEVLDFYVSLIIRIAFNYLFSFIIGGRSLIGHWACSKFMMISNDKIEFEIQINLNNFDS